MSNSGILLNPKKFPLNYQQFVVSTSANSDELTMKLALTAGADAFIAKPFTLQAFYQKISQKLSMLGTNQSKYGIGNMR